MERMERTYLSYLVDVYTGPTLVKYWKRCWSAAAPFIWSWLTSAESDGGLMGWH